VPETTFAPRPPKGIGGWLVLPALGLPISLFRMGRDVYQLMPSYTTNAWFALTDPAGANYHPLAGALLTFELVANAALIVLSVTTLVLFFRRRSSLPTVYVAFLAAAFTTLLIDDLFALQVPAAAAAVTPKEWGALLRTLLFSGIWIAYFRRSERVRATFVERRHRAPVTAAAPDTVPIDVAEPA
jgi:hypothetical protein